MENADDEEVPGFAGVVGSGPHVVVDVHVWWQRFEISVSNVCCWIGGKGQSLGILGCGKRLGEEWRSVKESVL